MAEANFFHLGAQHFSIGLYGFNMQSAVVGLLQSTKPGSGSIEGKIISLSVSFSIFAFAASVALPPRFTTVLCRISFFFSVLACSFLLSPLAHTCSFGFPISPAFSLSSICFNFCPPLFDSLSKSPGSPLGMQSVMPHVGSTKLCHQ
eukprot:TRINITY_DN23874_c0_g2_i2.p1 TRINITY_DN23874_c0_g2~~TRINITY_DN23874_c0_g2_i2.p1  ORF type:complete len:147 (+),score=11.52 TRINITY_DN23874_c0_g2_i2:161-601(+)